MKLHFSDSVRLTGQERCPRCTSEKGYSLVLLALTMVVALSLVGLVTDIGYGFLTQVRLQGAVDTAAISAGDYLPDPVVSTTDQQIRDIARAVAADNLQLSGVGSIAAAVVNPALVDRVNSPRSVTLTGIATPPLPILDLIPNLGGLVTTSAASRVVAGPGTGGQRAVVFVLDFTGSMIGAEDNMRAGAKTLATMLAPSDGFSDHVGDYIAVVSYSTLINGDPDLPHFVIDRALSQFTDPNSILSDDVMARTASGRTDIIAPLAQSRLILAGAPNWIPARNKIVVLLTDGMANEGGDDEDEDDPCAKGVDRALIGAALESDLIRQAGGMLHTLSFDNINQCELERLANHSWESCHDADPCLGGKCLPACDPHRSAEYNSVHPSPAQGLHLHAPSHGDLEELYRTLGNVIAGSNVRPIMTTYPSD